LFNHYCVLITALLFSVTNYCFADIHPVSDSDHLQQLASQAFYRVPLQAVKIHDGYTDFLFLAPRYVPLGQSVQLQLGRVVCARRDNAQKFHTVWQHDLTSNAIDAVWWSQTAKNEQSAILVTLYDGSGLTFHAPESGPKLWHQFPIDQGTGMLYVDPGKTFFSSSTSQGHDLIFFEHDALFSFDILTGSKNVIYSLPNESETNGAYIAVQDLDDDGTTEVVADTSRFVAGKEPIADPSTMRVWHYQDNKLVEIWHGNTRNLITRQSFVLGLAPKKHFIITHEVTPGPSQPKQDLLCLYQWNGTKLNQIASSNNTLFPIVDRGLIPVKFDKTSAPQIVTVQSSGIGHIRIVVTKLQENNLIKVWESPNLNTAPRFGRADDYAGDGRQELPLLDGDKMFLLKQVGNTYTGWEALRYVPPPPPPSKPLEERFVWQQEDGLKPADPARNFLLLDGNHLIFVPANDREINALYRVQQVQQRILDLAKQSFPAAQVIARKVGDEDQEPRREIVAGKVVVITLTESEAKTAGKPLAVYAQEWVAAVKTVLMTLAKPPK